LWETDDLADSLLCDAFYRHTAATRWASVPASLQAATHWLRTATRSECAVRLAGLYGERSGIRPPDVPVPYADPQYWAGYLCFGV
jgi:CHAT domain-containing protein